MSRYVCTCIGAPYAKEDDLTIQTAKLASGDQVKVQLDVEVFKMMQQGHGGWNEQMAKVSLCLALRWVTLAFSLHRLLERLVLCTVF